MIEIEGLSKHYESSSGRIAAVSDFHLVLDAGDRFGLFGPSGCGKTTLLRCLAGLEQPDSGRIVIDGSEVVNARSGLNAPPWHRPIGLVFQDFALWPHMKVLDNVLFPLRHGRSTGFSPAESQSLAVEALRAVRLEGFEGRLPSELSGGQRQRVALARALVARPKVLLMDEPLSSLDAHLRRQTRNELVGILEEAGITTIFVSHDHFDALFMADRLGVMRDGRMVQAGSAIEMFARPTDVAVAEALNIGTTIPCWRDDSGIDGETSYVLEHSGQKLLLNRSSAHRQEDGTCSLLFRPDACSLWKGCDTGSGVQKLAGVVVQESYLGRGWCVLVRVANALIEVWESERPGVRLGQAIEIAVDTAQIQLVARGN